MADRYILIVDQDEAFHERIANLLPSSGIRLAIADGNWDEVVSLLERHRPQVVFIAVEMPGKEGFALFSKVKKARRNVPVVLSTGTVSKADMKLHEKLTIHAEAYVDKRTLTDDELVEILEARGLSLDESRGPVDGAADEVDSTAALEPGPSETTRSAEETVDPSGPAATALQSETTGEADIDPRLTPFLDPETAAIFAEVDEEATAIASRKTHAGDVSPERLAELERLVAELEEQLEQARRDARSSPFSSEFLNVREVTERKNEEIRALSESLARRDAYVLVVKRKLAELAVKLTETERRHDERVEEVTELKERLAGAQQKLEYLSGEFEDQQKVHEREVAALKEGLSQEQVRVTVTRHELEGQIAELRAERTKAVHESEEARARELKDLETALREEKAVTVAELKDKHAAKLKELEESRNRAVSEMRAEHEKELAALHEAHAAAMERSAAEAQEALREASLKSAEALKQSNAQRVSELRQAEEQRAADLEAAEKRYAAKVEALVTKHEAQRKELEKKAEAAVKANDSMLEEVNAKVEDVLRSWEKERQSHHQTRERYENELAELQAAHTKHLEQAEQDQFSTLAGLSRKFREERGRAIDAERARGQDRLDALAKEHAAALASLEKRHQEEVEKLQIAHESALGQKDRDAEQATRDAVERATAEIQAAREEEQRSHANQLASLRQSKESEIAGLQAAHMEALAKRDSEAQQALREAVEQVKTDTNDQIEQLRDEHTEALAGLRKDYEDELAALEQAHRLAVEQQETASRASLKSVEDERDAARTTIDELRAEIAEMAAEHRSTLTVTEEQHKAELKDLQKALKSQVSQLEDDKQFLATSIEKLKRQSSGELKRVTDALAHEKQLHQGTRERYERRVSELKGRHAEGIKRLESDWMQKLERLETSVNARTEKVTESNENAWKTKFDKLRLQHEEAIASLRKEFEMELAASTQQLERARGFEDSYQDVSRELASWKGRAETLAQELADSQRELEERDKVIAEHAKKVSDSKETINSLKAVIDDFSRSVDGYLKDRDDQDQTISSLKAVIDDMYRSIDGGEEPRN